MVWILSFLQDYSTNFIMYLMTEFDLPGSSGEKMGHVNFIIQILIHLLFKRHFRMHILKQKPFINYILPTYTNRRVCNHAF